MRILTPVLVLTVACQDPGVLLEPATGSTHAIVNGTPLEGWDAVGALVGEVPGPGYVGQICTGTLIAPEWVLTAGHCFGTSAEEREQIVAEGMQFYVGTDARPGENGARPAAGELYQAAELIPHPQFTGQMGGGYDIALMRLSEPVADVTPIPPSNAQMSSSFQGVNALYIGFGATVWDQSLGEPTGEGVKLYTYLQIGQISQGTYTSSSQSSSLCMGDSGGPGMVDIEEQTVVIGVNSILNGSYNPCQGSSTQTRVDVFYDWLVETMAASDTSCLTDADFCFCAEACQDDGYCHNEVCEVLDCHDTDVCLSDCSEQDLACTQVCYGRATPAARETLNAMLFCFHDNCEEVAEDERMTCVEESCMAEVEACHPRVTGDATCAQVNACMSSCDSEDDPCLQDCYEQGTAEAQAALNAMGACFESECADAADAEAWNACAAQSCGVEIEACLQPANCDLRGGECPATEACLPLTTGGTDCFPSDGGLIGESCAGPTACADGSICDPSASACMPMCLDEADCPTGWSCRIPVWPGLDGVGVCECVGDDCAGPGTGSPGTCIDNDGDGVCPPIDCNDDDASVAFTCGGSGEAAADDELPGVDGSGGCAAAGAHPLLGLALLLRRRRRLRTGPQ